MKRRTAFVANSSSSSFLVVFRDLSPEESSEIFDHGIIPEHIKDKVECMTGRSMSEGDDVVYINDITLPAIIQNSLTNRFRRNSKVIVSCEDQYEFVIKPEFVGNSVMLMEKDYHSTNGDVDLLLQRYVR